MKKKSNQYKMNPDKDLAPEQILELNKEFYTKYYIDYFSTKLSVLGSMLNNAEKFTNIINENDIKVGVYEVKAENINGESNDIIKYVKLELSVLYYHCLETFLRLFLSHISLKQCPWLELSRDTNPKNFKEKIKALSEGKFDFHHDSWTSDELITYIFYGTKDIKDIKGIPKDLSLQQTTMVLKEWLIWSSQKLLQVYDYNSFKHGLSLYSDTKSIKLGFSGDENLQENGDSLVFINKGEKENRYVWKKNIIFTPLDFRAVSINIVQLLITNIFNVGKYTYLSQPCNKVYFVGSNPNTFYKMTKTKNKLGIALESYSMELRYIDEKENIE